MLAWLMRRQYDKVHRKDLAAIMAWWADDAVFEFPGATRISGRFEGKPAIEAWWRRWLDRMESVRFSFKRGALANPFGFTVANTLFTEWEANLVTRDGIPVRAEGVTMTKLRRGKAVYVRDYFYDATVWDAVWGAPGPA